MRGDLAKFGRHCHVGAEQDALVKRREKGEKRPRKFFRLLLFSSRHCQGILTSVEDEEILFKIDHRD